eukprot:4824595-Pleurochrysis_carterae.AAC.5
MAHAEAVLSEELGFVDRKFTSLWRPRDFHAVHSLRTPAAYPEDAIASRNDGVGTPRSPQLINARAKNTRPSRAADSTAESVFTNAHLHTTRQ